MENFFKHHSAETILEVIIAVAVFMVILAPASALYISSIHTIAGNRNDLIAAALAEEGIEMLRNMRDTNLLKFSPKAQECWNTKPEHTVLTNAAVTAQNCENNKIPAQKFKLTLNPDTLVWNFQDPSPLGSQLSEPKMIPAISEVSNIEEYRLRHDIATQTNPECTGGPGVPAGCSVHTSLYFVAPSGGFASRGETSPFYRQITVDYLDLDVSGVADSADPAMRVTSLVQYRRGNGEPRNIKRVLILTNQPS